MWVLRTSLTTPDRIAALVQAARDHGFNTLLVQVRGRGDAYFLGGIEPRPPELLRQPEGFDPLASVLTPAHAAGLRVHAWVNVNLVVERRRPAGRARARRSTAIPAWLMVPRDIAQELAKIEPESPAYVGKLARWTRAQPAERRRPVCVADSSRTAAIYTEGDRARHRAPLRDRRHPPRLRPLSERPLRLQPRRHPAVPHVCPARLRATRPVGRSMRAKPWTCSPIPMRCPTSGAASASRG